LGLTSLPVSKLFGENSKNVKFLLNGKLDRNYVPSFKVHSIRPAFRTGREGRQIEQVLITLTQEISVDVGDPEAPKEMIFRGGCSIILSLGNLNKVEHVIQKNIKSYDRFLRQKAYIRGESDTGAVPVNSLYADDDHDQRLDFHLLHQQ
jgi:hypothetical protein